MVLGYRGHAAQAAFLLSPHERDWRRVSHASIRVPLHFAPTYSLACSDSALWHHNVMEQQATYDDAKLILQLYEMRREERLREARKWFVANFYCQTFEEMTTLCPPGSETNASSRMVTSYWEMVASFIASGVLNEKLFFQSGTELLLTWIRVKPVLAATRTAFANPAYLANLETVGERFIEHWNRTSPGAFEAFKARIGTRPAQTAKA